MISRDSEAVKYRAHNPKSWVQFPVPQPLSQGSMRAISPQEYLKRENAINALIKLLTELDVLGSRCRPFKMNNVWVSQHEIHSFLHRQVKYQL